MKILYLTHCGIEDNTFGGALRSNNMRQALLEVGEVHTVVIHGAAQFQTDLVWSASLVKKATYSSSGFNLGALVQRRQICNWLRTIFDQGRYDVVVARYLGLALFLPFRAWKNLILDADDIFKHLPPQKVVTILGRIKNRFRNSLGHRAARAARHVWVVNPLDGNRIATSHTSSLGNSARIPNHTRAKVSEIAGRILMVGFFEHPPNADGLIWFVQNVMPKLREMHPLMELHVVGKHATDFGINFASDVRVRGFVDDLVVEYDKACLVVAPIHYGGGTQIKVLEALAHGKPLVLSSFSHLGFADQLRDKEHLLVAETAEAWAAACHLVLLGGGFVTEMAANGAHAVREHYSNEQFNSAVRSTLVGFAPVLTVS